MAPSKQPTDKDIALRYRTKLSELRDQRTGSAAVPAKQQHAVKMWLIDAGCGHDLVTNPHALMLKRWIRQAEMPIALATANGSAEADQILEAFVEEFGQTIKPYILDSTPVVISVGM
eukprot:5205950-Alexandrium_andersonii.AAC.1